MATKTKTIILISTGLFFGVLLTNCDLSKPLSSFTTSSAQTYEPSGIAPTPTSIFRQSSFVLPNDGIPNNNQPLGPFCCTGKTAIVFGNDGNPEGYIYFYSWDGQAYNVGDNRSIAPDIKILVSGVADLSDVHSEQQESSISFSAVDMIQGQSRSTRAGDLYYQVTIENANLETLNGITYFDMGSVVVIVDVSTSIP